jgi:hypothetical protein
MVRSAAIATASLRGRLAEVGLPETRPPWAEQAKPEADCVAVGQQQGAIKRKQPAGDLAKMLLGAFLGVRVLARSNPTADLLSGVTRPYLRS